MNRISVLLTLCAAMAHGQHMVSGRVTDPSGSSVEKAKVTLSPDLETATDAKGRFRFASLPDGNYELKAKATGFQSAKKSVVVAGAPVSLTLSLEVAAGKDSVTVAAKSGKVLEEAVDPDRNADRLNFEDNVLDSLPAPGNDALGVVSKFLSPAAQGAEGVTLSVDGVETSAASLPASSIRRLRVNRNPYSAQFRRPGKARVDVYSEEGSMRRLRGSFGISARNSIFDARNAFAPSRPPMDRTMFDANFSGPLTRGRSSYYFNGEHYRNNDTAVVNARTLDGPVQANIAVPERRTRVLGRFESTGEAHQIALQTTWLDQSEQNRGAGGLRLAEQGVPSSTRVNRVQFSDRVLLFGKMLNDFRVVAQRETAERGAIASGPAVQVHGAFTGGPSQTDWLRRETGIRLQDTASLTRGKHNLRFGVEGRPGFHSSVERSQFEGTYEFGSLASFAESQALLYRVIGGNPNVTLRQHEAFGFIQDETALARGLNVNFGVRYGWQSDVNDGNNFAPRAGFAWAPGNGKTVFRGGAGVFYERVTEDVRRRTLLWNGVRLRESVFQNVSYPFVPDSLPPPSLVRSAGLDAPVLTQASLAVEQQLFRRTTIAAEYQHLRGRHLLRSRNVNAPSFAGARPDPSYLNINLVESSASMQSNSATVTLRSSIGKRLTGMAQYALSRTLDDTTGPFGFPANSFDARTEWGRSDYDQRHRFNAALMAELPSGFRIGSFLSFASGAPFNVTTGRDGNGDSIVNDRPAGVHRNTGHGPGFAQVDIRLTRQFRAPRLLERNRKSTSRNIEISIDAFNLLNRVNFSSFHGVLSSPFFGFANAALPPRTIQLSLRYKL